MEVLGHNMDPRLEESVQKNIAVTEFAILSAIIISLVLKFRLIFLLNIDGDEFAFLSWVHQYGSGLANPYFTFHVHLFSWLPSLSGDEISQIIAARVAMFFLGIGSCTLIYFICRRFLGRIGALFSVLCYLSVSNVILHGTSFRFDPLCVFFLLAAIYLILKKKRTRFSLVVAGLCVALSFLISLKSVFYVFAITGIFSFMVLFSGEKKDVLLDIAFILGVFAFGSIALFIYHNHTLSGAALSHQGDYLVYLAQSKILFKNFLPNKIYSLLMVIENLAPMAFGVAGIFIVLWEITRRRNIPENFFLLCLLFPFIALFFYEFNFPYFYVFLLSPGMAIFGVLPDRIVEIYKRDGSRILLACLIGSYVIIFLSFLGHYKKQSVDRTVTQKMTIETIHRMFPEPVPYIDRCSMVSSFPMVGIHMSTWVMEGYTEANRPIMRDILIRKRPVFILANIVHLNLSRPWGPGADIFRVDPLLEEDFNLLRENFLHHWGIIYVAGKRLEFDRGETAKSFENLIPGIYTIESGGEVSVNQVLYKPGSIIHLKNERYTVVPRKPPMKVEFRWGENLYRPPAPPPLQPVFFGYYY